MAKVRKRYCTSDFVQILYTMYFGLPNNNFREKRNYNNVVAHQKLRIFVL